MTDIPADTSIDWVEDVCSANLGTVAQINNTLYAIGGWLVLRDSSDPNAPGPYIANSHLHIIDFSPPSKTNTIIDLTKDYKSLFTAKRLPSTVPRTMWSNIFAYKSELHYFGGLQCPQPIYLANGKYDLNDRVEIGDKMWSYLIDEDEWVDEVDGEELVSGLGKDVLGQAAKAQVDSTNKEEYQQQWLFGGGVWTETYMIGNETIGNGTGFNELRDLIESKPGVIRGAEADEISLEKVSTETAMTAKARPAVQASMVYVGGLGEEGVLVLMAGATNDQVVSLKEVHVYDIKSKVWYTQPTTAEGDTFPDDRREGCTVVAAAPDGSSHNIYLYGGRKPNEEGKEPPFLGLGEVWVLSLPTFQWIRSNQDFAVTRVGHSCNRIHNKYMISYRGLAPDPCDKNAGIQAYDMSLMEWTTKIETDPENSVYFVPEKVYSAIGGSRSGGATKVTPKGGFADPKLGEILYVAPGNSTSNPSTTSNHSNNTPPTSTASTAPDKNSGNTRSLEGTPRILAIAIPTVVLGLVLLALAFCFWSRRRRRAKIAEADEAYARQRAVELDHGSNSPGQWGPGHGEYYGELATQAKGASDPNLMRSELESNYPPAYELSGLEGSKRYSNVHGGNMEHYVPGADMEHYGPGGNTEQYAMNPHTDDTNVQRDQERGYNA